MISIEARIRTGLVLSLLLVMTLLALLVDYGVGRISRDFVVTRLQHDADSLINALSLSREGVWQLDQQRLPAIYQRVQSGHYFQLQSAQQKIRSRSLWDRTPTPPNIAPGQSQISQLRQDPEHWLIWQQSIELQGQPLSLWIAEDIAPFEQQWRRFSIIGYGVMGLALILLVLLQRTLLKRSFAQINAVQRAIGQLQQGEIETLSTQVPREIQPLTSEINHLLQRLQQRINRSRTSMGNLAHELKRILQRLQPLGQALPAATRAEYEQALAQIQQLTERELKRTRIAGSPQPGRRFKPVEELPHLIRLLERIYPNIDLTLLFDNESVPQELPYDRDDMLELIGNLLDNGCKFGATTVQLKLAIDNDCCRLMIDDDGHGVSAQQYLQLTERGVRIDESVEGHGLGLSICQMIVDSYQGEIGFSPASDSGGFRVKVELPLASLPRRPQP
ncbi:MAG: sensor histidine kinase [Halopseudomonas sp.]